MKNINQRGLPRARALALAAAVCGSLAVVACGGGSDGVDPIAKTVAKYSPFPVTIQPGQSVPNLSLTSSDLAQVYGVTLPVGTKSVKFEAVGGTGAPLVGVSPRSDFSTGMTTWTCPSQRTCQWSFAPTTAPQTIYVSIGTRSSYSGVTLNTYVGPTPNQVIPLNVGEAMTGITAGGADVFYTINTPPGSTQVGVTLTDGNGFGELGMNGSLTNWTGVDFEPGNVITATIDPNSPLYFFAGNVSSGGSFANYTMTGYAQ